MSKTNLAIFASGSGTNTENIANYFQNRSEISISRIFTNRSDAYVLQRSKRLNISSYIFSREEFKSPTFINQLEDVDYIILAGFLWLIPKYLIEAFPDRIINIHPALLPKFGGKGMYGDHVHKAVIDAGEKESGITIHLVNEEYDKGEILFQAKCEVNENDTPSSLAEKIHELEYTHFPKVIDDYILG